MNGYLKSTLGTFTMMIFISFAALAQEVSIPDSGLDAAIRDALRKPTGPLTQQDMLTLTNLNASARSIFNLQGLEAARNLIALDLQSNFIDNVSIPSTLTKLRTVDLSFSFTALRNCSFPDTLTNLSRVLVKTCALTNITLPNGLASLVELNLAGNRLGAAGFLTNLTELNNLDLENNRLSNFTLPSRLTNIFFLNLGFNLFLTNFSLPNGLSHLDTLRLEANGLNKLTLPTGLTRLLELSAGGNPLSNLVLPADATNLVTLDLSFSSLTNLTLPQELRTLVTLDLEDSEMRSLVLSPKLTRLESLNLNGNQLTNLVVPTGLTNLTTLDASFNQLRSLALPPPLPKLTTLNLGGNQLISLQLPPGMTNLQELFLFGNHLTNFSLPANLDALFTLQLADNQITTLTLPVDLTSLRNLVLNGNPLTTLVLSEVEAANLAQTVAALRAQGVSIIISSNSPPTVAITSPINGASFIAPATITIQAAASDSDGSVTNVQFFDGVTSLGNRSSSPYSLSVSLAVGSHALTAVASDNLGARTTSLPVTVTGLTVIVISGTTRLPDGAFQFTFTNTPGASFTVLTTTNPAVPVDEWKSAGAVLEASPGSYQFTDVTTDSPLRFYRVRSP
ncbi:MAG TPA: leucine-rich repeat domain-containing protein [Verrucomicrobiae bacterium]|nr:leucine-rich repeat domain-containing protein [Verrucomicrobiae bacterium]